VCGNADRGLPAFASYFQSIRGTLTRMTV
jgi:hypothetical protein